MNKQYTALLASLGSTTLSIKPNTALSTISVVDVVGTGNSFNDAAEKISNLLQKEIMMYKNVMVPTIHNIVKNVEEAVSARNLELLVQTPDVAVVETPTFIDRLLEASQLFDPSINGYLSESGTRIPLVKDIYEYLKFENVEANAAFKKFLRKYSKEQLETIWEKYITDMNKGNRNISSLLNYKAVKSDTVDDIFVVYTILTNLAIATPETAIGTLDGFRDAVVIFKMLVSKSIIERINVTNQKVNSGILVLINRDRNKDIVVFKDSLDKFYEKGGTIDTLYGLAISEKSELVTIDDISRLNVDLTNEWTSVYNASVVKIKANSVGVYKAIYASILTKVFDENDHRFNPYTNEETYKKFRTTMNELSYIELHDVFTVVEKVFLEILYANTNAKEFFGYVRYYAKDSDLETGVTLATMELAAGYIVSQIEVSS